MRLMIDLDGVCANFYGRILEWYNRDYGDNLTIDKVTSWDFKPSIYTKASDEQISSYFNIPDFWRGMAPLPDCQDVMSNLMDKGHDLLIITAVPEHSKNAFWEKGQWVRAHLPFIPYRNFGSFQRKELVGAELIFDDGPHNLIDFPGKTCAMNYPYNQDIVCDYRVNSWKAFEGIIEELNESKM